MYYKISNAVDLRCLYCWLLESQGEKILEKLRPVVKAVSFAVDTLERCYKGNHNPDYRGGFVVFFDHEVKPDNTYLKELLDYYNIDSEEYESREILCSYQDEEHIKTEWVSNLFIMTDFQIVIIYPIKEGGI